MSCVTVHLSYLVLTTHHHDSFRYAPRTTHHSPLRRTVCRALGAAGDTRGARGPHPPSTFTILLPLQRRYRELTKALPPQVQVYYAIKANPSLRLVQELTALGAGMEIASAGELAVAERLGISGDRVLFTGPAKTDDELAASVRYGLRTINVESLGEAQRLDALSAQLGRRQPILLRVNARFEVHDADAAVQLGGGAQKFGR